LTVPATLTEVKSLNVLKKTVPDVHYSQIVCHTTFAKPNMYWSQARWWHHCKS